MLSPKRVDPISPNQTVFENDHRKQNSQSEKPIPSKTHIHAVENSLIGLLLMMMWVITKMAYGTGSYMFSREYTNKSRYNIFPALAEFR